MRESSFVDRWLAEQDSSVLQLIPYVVCFNSSGKVLSYQRKGGGEGRLEGKCSVGIGGHVNTSDHPWSGEDVERLKNSDELQDYKITWQTLQNGALREVTEELDLSSEYVFNNLMQLGVVYAPSDDGGDPSSPGPAVGEVHIGIVYGLIVPDDVKVRDNEGMIKPKFVVNPPNIQKYERWSQLVLMNIEDIKSELSNA